MTVVFIFNVYSEDGPEEIRVAATPEAALRIFDELAADTIEIATEAKWLPVSEVKMALAKARNMVAALAAAPVVGSINLMSGWGGYQLHLTKVED